MNIQEIWDNALVAIRQNMSSMVGYNTYIKVIKPVSYENGVFTLSVPMELTKNMIELRYAKDLELSLSKSIGEVVKTKFILESDIEQIQTKPTPPPHQTSVQEHDSFYSDPLNPDYTFDNFVTGPSNQYAYAVALNIAKTPGLKRNNPLFLYGSSGLGKTHLIHAIGNEIISRYPEKKVLYITSERFVNDLITSINEKNTDAFRQHYRRIDVLLLDDVQFMAGKESTQMEFFHTFNELYNHNKQIVLTSDRKPKDLVTLEDRLRTRFDGGLPIDIITPDFETRVAILQKEADSANIQISEKVFQYIADRIKSSVRELKGALSKVISYVSINHVVMDIDTAQGLIKSFVQDEASVKITDKMIIDKVCTYYNVTKQDILGSSRTKNVTLPRQVSMYLCKTLTDMGFTTISKSFGNKDHTTIMHNVKKITNQLEIDPTLKADVDCITQDLRSI